MSYKSFCTNFACNDWIFFEEQVDLAMNNRKISLKNVLPGVSLCRLLSSGPVLK